jgi:hypothetical protein
MLAFEMNSTKKSNIYRRIGDLHLEFSRQEKSKESCTSPFKRIRRPRRFSPRSATDALREALSVYFWVDTLNSTQQRKTILATFLTLAEIREPSEKCLKAIRSAARCVA